MSMLHLKIGLVLLFMCVAVGLLILVGRNLVCIHDEMNHLFTLSVLLQPAGDHHRHKTKPPDLIVPIYHHHQHHYKSTNSLKMPSHRSRPSALPQLLAHKIDLFEGNVNRRGRVRPTLAKKHWDWPGNAFYVLLCIALIVSPVIVMIIIVAPIVKKFTSRESENF